MNAYEQMRDALNDIGNACAWIAENCGNEQTATYMWDLVEKAKSALAIPRRQCDVGTAEEQGERCLAQFEQWRRKGEGKKVITAIMEWAQTPYAAEEGGAE